MSSSMCLLELQGTYGEVWAEGGQGHWVNIASTPEPSTSKVLPPAEISLGFFLTSYQIKQTTKNGMGTGEDWWAPPPMPASPFRALSQIHSAPLHL